MLCIVLYCVVVFAGGRWQVFVTTNELPAAGTDAQVTLTVYGHRGNSGPIPLGYSDGQTFQAGNIDEFEVQVNLSIINDIHEDIRIY